MQINKTLYSKYKEPASFVNS